MWSRVPAQPLQFCMGLFTYVRLSVVMKEVHKNPSKLFFSNGFRKFLHLSSVIGSGDGVDLLKQSVVQHSY